MNDTFKVVVVAGVITGLALDTAKSVADVPQPHTHEEPLGPMQTVAFQTVAATSGKEMSGQWPLFLVR